MLSHRSTEAPPHPLLAKLSPTIQGWRCASESATGSARMAAALAEAQEAAGHLPPGPPHTDPHDGGARSPKTRTRLRVCDAPGVKQSEQRRRAVQPVLACELVVHAVLAMTGGDVGESSTSHRRNGEVSKDKIE